MTKQEIHALIHKTREGDDLAKDELVRQHIDLVWSIVHKFVHADVDREDLFQIGCLGLLKSINQFDISFDTTLSTYAVPLIIGEIKAFMREQTPIKISRLILQNASKIAKVKDELSKKLEREPTITEIAEVCDMSKDQIIMALNAPTNVTSIDNQIEGEVPAIERIALDNQKIDLDESVILKELVKGLAPAAQMLVYLRYDLGLTQSEVAKRLDMNQVAVSRLEKKILKDLKEKMIS